MTQQPWFRNATLYQIYPRSFYDTNNDGVGDLAGITAKLDYLKGNEQSLGVDAIWISPFYPSPMADFGYDVANYCNVDPLFGTLEDFDKLVSEAHARDIKILVDFVPNHTSNQHPWFKESRASKDDPKRNWYVWADPKPDGSPPNNWLGVFGGSAWELDAATGQYYLHSFLKEQPDLNWDNPDVRDAMSEALAFWLKRGVDGFRVDAVQWLGKDSQLRDDPLDPAYDAATDTPYHTLLHTYSKRGSALFTHLKGIADAAKAYKDDCLLIVEAYPHKLHSIDEYITMYQHIETATMAPFNFEAISLKWDAAGYKAYYDTFQDALKPEYLPIHAVGNHDMPRVVARLGGQRARAIAVLLLTLPGLPVIYYGDELGMDGTPIPPEAIRDPFAKSTPKAGRDPERTPMQWSNDTFAGFSTTQPWLPIGDTSKVNVQAELDDEQSMLNLYRRLLALRRGSPALLHGEYRPVDTPNQSLFAFARDYQDERIVTIINFSNAEQDCPVPGKTILSTHQASEQLQPFEARIVRPAQP
ncbi:MAG TPA: alpha-amylase family glycosyl hydrolase [Patescibacteria group bacterium]|nr:alpha-amylase family glycosyl hydrolase [Patescibacteria group bacterium]